MIGVLLSGDIISGPTSYISFEITLLSIIQIQMNYLFIIYKIHQLFLYTLSRLYSFKQRLYLAQSLRTYIILNHLFANIHSYARIMVPKILLHLITIL